MSEGYSIASILDKRAADQEVEIKRLRNLIANQGDRIVAYGRRIDELQQQVRDLTTERDNYQKGISNDVQLATSTNGSTNDG